jgi:general secretion pathway protein I
LIKDGFPDMDEEESDNFDEQGFPSFSWKTEIKKVDLPLGAAFDYLLQSFGKTGEDGEGGMAGMLGKLGESGSQLTGLLKGAGGAAGGLGGAASSLLNPEMLKGNVDMLSDMLEQAIREVRLTVFWGEGREDEQLVITNHLVMVPQGSAASGATPMPGMTPASGIPGKGGVPGRAGLVPGRPGIPGSTTKGLK